MDGWSGKGEVVVKEELFVLLPGCGGRGGGRREEEDGEEKKRAGMEKMGQGQRGGTDGARRGVSRLDRDPETDRSLFIKTHTHTLSHTHIIC